MTDSADPIASLKALNPSVFVKTYPGVTFEAGTVGGVAGEWAIPDQVPNTDAAVIYIHGGGYVAGRADNTRLATSRLSKWLGLHVFAPNYRLAPRHPFPAQQDDVMKVYQALLQDGVAPSRIAIAGDSAGAALTVTLAADARDRGIPMPACLMLNSPYADVALLTPSLDDPVKNQYSIKRAMVENLSKALLSTGGVDPMDPRHSPVYRDLSGLPPMLIQAAGRDVCHDDAVRLAASARAVGVPVQFTEYPDSEHIFIVWGSYVLDPVEGFRNLGFEPEACARAVHEMVEFARSHFEGDFALPV